MCDLEALGVPSIFKLIHRKASALVRMLPTLVLTCEENAARRSETDQTHDSSGQVRESGQGQDKLGVEDLIQRALFFESTLSNMKHW